MSGSGAVAAPPIRMMLVEDDPAYARLVLERLRGHRDLELVGTAATLAEGIALASRLAPQVVMLDLGLPDSEGAATLTAFREVHARLPIVVLSGLGDIAVALEAMRLGAQEYLVKGQGEADLFPRAAHLAIERHRLSVLEQMLLGVVSHDLRTPLQTVTVACELEMARSDDALTKKNLGRAVASVRRAVGLVNDLLDATRARLGGLFPIVRERADLVGIVEQVVTEYRTNAERWVIALDAPAALPAVVDGRRIAQVVGNLVGNAIQHGDRAEPIAVWLRRVDEVDGEIEIGVRNVGAPIPEELRGRLFAPLERAASSKREHGGHSIGLGLYIAHEIVKAHGGTIAVESTRERGTTFRIRLPAAATA